MGLGTVTQRLLGRPVLKERRRYPRLRDPALLLVVEGRKYETIDWSLGGFLIRDFHRGLEIRETVEGKVRGRGPVASGTFTAIVVRKAEDGGVGFRFLEISSKTWMSLSAVPP